MFTGVAKTLLRLRVWTEIKTKTMTMERAIVQLVVQTDSATSHTFYEVQVVEHGERGKSLHPN